MEENLLSVLEFAVKVKKSPQTIYTMIFNGEIEVKRTLVRNRTITRIPSSELTKFET